MTRGGKSYMRQFKEQAILMCDRLKAAEVDVELVTLEGAGHGFKGEDAKRANQAALDFIDKHLKSGH